MGIIDITGERYHSLKVVRFDHIKDGKSYWLCKCDCGKFTIQSSNNLRRSRVKSCGCKRYDKFIKMNTKHGKHGTRIYNIWKGIKTRCLNPNHGDYKNYGGRGITICSEWMHNFQEFYDWSMAHGYSDNLTIDRINVNGNYEPSNCRWVTMKEQAHNKRNTA